MSKQGGDPQQGDADVLRKKLADLDADIRALEPAAYAELAELQTSRSSARRSRAWRELWPMLWIERENSCALVRCESRQLAQLALTSFPVNGGDCLRLEAAEHPASRGLVIAQPAENADVPVAQRELYELLPPMTWSWLLSVTAPRGAWSSTPTGSVLGPTAPVKLQLVLSVAGLWAERVPA